MSENFTFTNGEQKKLASNIVAAIELYAQEAYDGGHRSHLGASLIGNECNAALWFGFRWVKHEKFSGRMLRLFNRGHKEEIRFVEWLRGIGCAVEEFDVDGVTQFRVSGVGGHFGGSTDGKLRIPTHYKNIEFGANLPPMLLEFKTSGQNGFVGVKNKGVMLAKPIHYAQMCTYGRKLGLDYAMYFVINKNDDEIHCEIVKLDHRYGAQLEEKAEKIITAKARPERLSNSPAHQTCKYCPFTDICHKNAPVEKNCRSCRNARPVDSGQWYCDLYQNIIPKDFIKEGCAAHSSVV